MGKVGNYDYPETRIDECLRIAKVLVNEFPNGVNDINAFASAIGHKSANSGGYLVKIADVRKFNLMDKRVYGATHLAEIISNPKNDAEKKEALNKMIFSVSLFKLLHDRLRTKSPTIEQLRTQLIDLTSDRNSASKDAEKIRKVYISAMSYVSEDFGKTPSNQNPEDDFNMNDENENNGSVEDMIFIKAGKMKLSLPLNNINIDLVKNALDGMKTK